MYMIKLNSQTSERELAQINELLEKAGIHFSNDDGFCAVLDLTVLKAFMKRNAGRPYKPLKENGFLAHVTKGEIRKRMMNETAEQIAGSLGISRRTLFRRLAECRNDEDELL